MEDVDIEFVLNLFFRTVLKLTKPFGWNIVLQKVLV